jgi:large subunit ribosomal protein L3
MKQIIGRKMGMTQIFAEDGTMYAVTVVEVLPNVVTQVKTSDSKDGYDAIQVGYEDKKESSANKCEKGLAKKTNTAVKKHYAELKGDEMKKYKVGDVITCDLFKTGDVVDVIGKSKGQGFMGAIARWNMIIGPKGHGSGYHRKPGSFANNGRTNNRVIPGKHMSGHDGNESATILNLVVVKVDSAKNAILIKGALPGSKKSYVTIRSAVKVQAGKPEIIKPLVNNVKAAPIAEAVIEKGE